MSVVLVGGAFVHLDRDYVLARDHDVAQDPRLAVLLQVFRTHGQHDVRILVGAVEHADQDPPVCDYYAKVAAEPAAQLPSLRGQVLGQGFDNWLKVGIWNELGSVVNGRVRGLTSDRRWASFPASDRSSTLEKLIFTDSMRGLECLQ